MKKRGRVLRGGRRKKDGMYGFYSQRRANKRGESKIGMYLQMEKGRGERRCVEKFMDS
jgi:hypothetical protein